MSSIIVVREWPRWMLTRVGGLCVVNGLPEDGAVEVANEACPPWEACQQTTVLEDAFLDKLARGRALFVTHIVLERGTDRDGTVHEDERVVVRVDDVPSPSLRSLASSPSPSPVDSSSDPSATEGGYESSSDDCPEWLLTPTKAPLFAQSTTIYDAGDHSVDREPLYALQGIVPPKQLLHICRQQTTLLTTDDRSVRCHAGPAPTTATVGTCVVDVDSFDGSRYLTRPPTAAGGGVPRPAPPSRTTGHRVAPRPAARGSVWRDQTRIQRERRR